MWDWLGSRIQRYSAKQLASGIEVAALRVSCEPMDRDGTLLRLRSRLGVQNGPEGRPLVVDFAGSSLTDQNVVGDEFVTCLPADRARSRSAAVVALRTNGSWDGTEITVQGRWNAARPPERPPSVTLSIPEEVPLVASAEYVLAKQSRVAFLHGNLPREILLDGPLPGGVAVGGVSVDPFDDGGPFPPTRFLQLTLCVPPATELGQGFPAAVLAGSGSAALSAEARDRVRAVAQEAVSFVESECGVPGRVRPVVVLQPEERVRSDDDPCLMHPAPVALEPALAARLPWVVMHLTKLWWGVGCRVRGIQGSMILPAVGLAMALQCTERWDEASPVAEMAARWRQQSRGRQAHELIETQCTLAGKLARALDKPSAREAFQAFTRASWGRVIGVDALHAEMRRWCRM